MPSILDTIDRLTYTANSLHSIAPGPESENIGPFTQAMLHSSLQEIIRDADETEYDLFHFVTHQNDTSTLGQGRLERKEYKAATPLRLRRAAGKIKDEEPEVYLEAALRYLDRFHTVKPMPETRAHLESLVERLDNARDQLDELQKSMQETERKVPPTAQIREEEKAISELKAQILHLKKRKDALKNTIGSTTKQAAPSAFKTATSMRLQPSRPQASSLISKGCISAPSTQIHIRDSASSTSHEHNPVPSILNTTSDDNDEAAVSVSKLDDLPPIQNELTRIPMPARPEFQHSSLVPQVIPISTQEEKLSDPSSTKPEVGQMRVTPEMKRICARIWDTIADILIPGNHFAQTGKVPNANDTISILETISSQPISECGSAMSSNLSSSPSTRSTLSSILGMEIHPPPTGVPHQVLTARALLTLLKSPNHSIPLNTLKVQLARTESNLTLPSGMAKQATMATFGSTDSGSRAIYGCVAKKLIKIDRGGGEQIVSLRICMSDFTVFGYGSLIFKPPPHVVSQVAGYLKGYVRRFAQSSSDHRGTPEHPGRVVTLIHHDDWAEFRESDPFPEDGVVWGVAYSIDREFVAEVQAYLDYREKDGYTVERADVYRVVDGKEHVVVPQAIVYVGRKDNPSFVGFESLHTLAKHIWGCSGPSGSNKEYVYRLADAVRALAPDSYDSHLYTLEKLLKELDKAEGIKD